MSKITDEQMAEHDKLESTANFYRFVNISIIVAAAISFFVDIPTSYRLVFLGFAIVFAGLGIMSTFKHIKWHIDYETGENDAK